MSRREQDGGPIDLSDIRWKMLVACDTCRRRKVRCDGQRPCVRCSKGSKACTFSTPASRRPTAPSLSSRHPTLKETRSASNTSTPESTSSTDTTTTQVGEDYKPQKSKTSSPTKSSKEHLLLIDSDDQIVYSGPSTGMPLFARLGLLHTVEVSESDKNDSNFASHSAEALGIIGATTSSDDYIDLCFQTCPPELMDKLMGHHLDNPLFFPLLHPPSFLSEFTAITQRRLACTAQYGALLMSILAVTVRLVEGARALIPPSERNQAADTYFELAQDFLRISKNKLDIRYILALYHLAVFAEGRTGSAGSVSSFVAEAVGLAFTTGLHRSTVEFNMDPVTLQIRTRLFWALYTLDTALAYSQGRPPLIRLTECSVDLPVIVDNEYIKKTEILPQPENNPPLAIAAAVKMVEIYMVLEQVLSAINAPSKTPAAAYFLGEPRPNRGDLMRRAQMRIDEIESHLPSYLSQGGIAVGPTRSFLFSSRIRTVLQFIRTLIARQLLVDELESSGESSKQETSFLTLEACRLSVDTVKMYSRLRHLGLLRFCGFHAVSHVTAAAHTLIACMLKNSNLALEHRPDLLMAIDILLVLSSLFPHAETVAQLLVQLSRNLDDNHGSNTQSEAVAIRVLARRMARSPPRSDLSSGNDDHFFRLNADPLLEQGTGSTASYSQQFSIESSLPAVQPGGGKEIASADDTGSIWSSPTYLDSLDPQWTQNASDHAVWADSFSFLNDGLFSRI